MMHPEYTRSSSGARKHAQVRLGIGALLVTLLGCGDGVTISTPKGDCVAPDQTVVRQNVTQAQCAEICPTCSWVGGDDQ